MKKATTTVFLSTALVLLGAVLPLAFGNDATHPKGGAMWFRRSVTWQAGKEPRPWGTTVVSPNGKIRYKLALVPLWAVEGGIVAIEIVVAHPEQPNRNLLGERGSHESERFVVTVEELENGTKQSLFGADRVFDVGRARLRVKITGWRLGKGVGDCATCDNIQELTSELIFQSK